MKSLRFTLLALAAMLLNVNFAAAQTPANPGMQVIQFHLEHRCITCLKIEKLTKETLVDYKSIPFSLVNVEDKKNTKMAADFQAAGTALFLFNPKTGKKKELTQFAFMSAGDEGKFRSGLKKEIDAFLKR